MESSEPSEGGEKREGKTTGTVSSTGDEDITLDFDAGHT
jgi:hypothetical protein